MVVADARSGASLPVKKYFDALLEIKRARGLTCSQAFLDGRCVAVHTPLAECGLDNGFNLLETALVPVQGGVGGLDRLAQLAHQELTDTLQALQADGACILNVAQHPACARSRSWYEDTCVPRPIYRELREHRGWHHWEGIDAKAQNGANTSVPVGQAVRALNVAVALAPTSIALFANSPLESGVRTGYKENRMTLWSRVFGPSRFPGDLFLSTYPDRAFHDLADFFNWMFGPGTVTRGLPMSLSYDYKSVPVVILDADPSLLEFLHARQWTGRRTDNGLAVTLQPQAQHFVYSQIGQFLDARLRYRMDQLPALQDVLHAWRQDGGLEALFAAYGAQLYIEARAPGAGFADQALLDAAGPDIARSMLVSPTALQAGLLGNLDQAWQLVNDVGWKQLGELRLVAMRAGLEDDRVCALCADVLAVARAGLPPQDVHWLAYPEFVQDERRCAADRLLDTWTAAGRSEQARLAAVLDRHCALHPQQFSWRSSLSATF
nr:glutamate-cysteine ligase family protein [Pusillimonas sp. MFBS29]